MWAEGEGRGLSLKSIYRVIQLNVMPIRILDIVLVAFNIFSSTEQSGNMWQASRGIHGGLGCRSQGSKRSPATEKDWGPVPFRHPIPPDNMAASREVDLVCSCQTSKSKCFHTPGDSCMAFERAGASLPLHSVALSPAHLDSRAGSQAHLSMLWCLHLC